MKNIELSIPEMDKILEKLTDIDRRLLSMTKDNPGIKTWLNTKEVAKLLQVTPRTIQTYRDQGILPFAQFGREVRYRSEDIQAFLMNHYVRSNNGGPENE
jgi:excisionase family DNA binding protein